MIQGTEISIPEGLLEIGQSSFGDCRNLIEITIPESVRTLGSHCFWNCNSLERIVILIPNNQFSIVCHNGNNAEKYAREHDLQMAYLE